MQTQEKKKTDQIIEAVVQIAVKLNQLNPNEIQDRPLRDLLGKVLQAFSHFIGIYRDGGDNWTDNSRKCLIKVRLFAYTIVSSWND